MNGSRYNNITDEQRRFREMILKKKPRKRKAYVPIPARVISRNEYMNNCMFWINEYEAGRTDKEEYLSATRSLYNYCVAIINENNPKPH